MSGECVGVAEVARLEVAAAEFDDRAAISRNRQRSLVVIDLLDGSAGSVLDAEDVRVAQADDPVGGGELAVGNGQPMLPEAAGGVHQ
jgi:hypothetical protein